MESSPHICCKRRKLLVVLFVTGVFGLCAQPLSVEVTATDNTDCVGWNCFYNGPTILINEVMLSPSSNDGSIAGGGDSRGGEWIELYNPHKCESADIQFFSRPVAQCLFHLLCSLRLQGSLRA